MGRETRTLFYVKDWQTKGVIRCGGWEVRPNGRFIRWSGKAGHSPVMSGKIGRDLFENSTNALVEANKRREKKVASLESQAKKLRAMRIDVLLKGDDDEQA